MPWSHGRGVRISPVLRCFGDAGDWLGIRLRALRARRADDPSMRRLRASPSGDRPYEMASFHPAHSDAVREMLPFLGIAVGEVGDAEALEHVQDLAAVVDVVPGHHLQDGGAVALRDAVVVGEGVVEAS